MAKYTSCYLHNSNNYIEYPSCVDIVGFFPNRCLVLYLCLTVRCIRSSIRKKQSKWLKLHGLFIQLLQYNSVLFPQYYLWPDLVVYT